MIWTANLYPLFHETVQHTELINKAVCCIRISGEKRVCVTFHVVWRRYVFCKRILNLIARFMEPTWGPSGADRTQVGPMMAQWTLLSGNALRAEWRVLCQKHASRAGTSNYIPQYLWDVITCPCPLCSLMSHTFSIVSTRIHSVWRTDVRLAASWIWRQDVSKYSVRHEAWY